MEISTNRLDILAKKLLDTLSQDNKTCKIKINELRKITRNRKKEIAQERCSKALVDMCAFGHLVGAGTVKDKAVMKNEVTGLSTDESDSTPSTALLEETKQGKLSTNDNDTGASEVKGVDTKEKAEDSKPLWMLEMEAMEDETGLTCAICQEGHTLQPTELLGIYAYLKKGVNSM
jgi:hypothetical protein